MMSESTSMVQKKKAVEKPKDYSEFNTQVSRINRDLARLEPLRKVIGKKSLDVMFIMDCTGSMGPWITAAK